MYEQTPLQLYCAAGGTPSQVARYSGNPFGEYFARSSRSIGAADARFDDLHAALERLKRYVERALMIERYPSMKHLNRMAKAGNLFRAFFLLCRNRSAFCLQLATTYDNFDYGLRSLHLEIFGRFLPPVCDDFKIDLLTLVEGA